MQVLVSYLQVVIELKLLNVNVKDSALLTAGPLRVESTYHLWVTHTMGQ